LDKTEDDEMLRKILTKLQDDETDKNLGAGKVKENFDKH
jgi:hypothetical protein